MHEGGGLGVDHVYLILAEHAARKDPEDTHDEGGWAHEAVVNLGLANHEVQAGDGKCALAFHRHHDAGSALKLREAMLKLCELSVRPAMLRQTLPEGVDGDANLGVADELRNEQGFFAQQARYV